jgi:hypothetical protein
MRRISIAALVAALVGGCTPSYLYQPATHLSANDQGQPTARYSVPPESPHGEVTLASRGIVDLSLGSDNERTRCLQVHMIVANNDDAPWVVDAREQLLQLPGEGQSRPALVNTEQQDLPNINVAPGQKRTVDLFYTLPQPLQQAKQIPEFDVSWHVQMPSRVVAERTPFERVKIEEPSDYYADAYAYDYGYGYGYGWGPVWWYDPFFPSLTFVHPVFIHEHRAFQAHHPFVAPGRVHVVGHPGFAHPGFVGGRPMGTFHAGAGGFHGGAFHGSAFHGGGGFHGGGFHGGGGGGHGGGHR